MVGLHWNLNRPEDTPLFVFVRTFPERIARRGKIHPRTESQLPAVSQEEGSLRKTVCAASASSQVTASVNIPNITLQRLQPSMWPERSQLSGRLQSTSSGMKDTQP